VAGNRGRRVGHVPVGRIGRIAAGVGQPPEEFEGIKAVPFRGPVIDDAVQVVNGGRLSRDIGLVDRQVEDPAVAVAEFGVDGFDHQRIGVMVKGGVGQKLVGRTLADGDGIDDIIGDGVGEKDGIGEIDGVRRKSYRIADIDGVGHENRVGGEFDIFDIMHHLGRLDDFLLVAAGQDHEHRNQDQKSTDENNTCHNCCLPSKRFLSGILRAKAGPNRTGKASNDAGPVYAVAGYRLMKFAGPDNMADGIVQKRQPGSQSSQ